MRRQKADWTPEEKKEYYAALGELNSRKHTPEELKQIHNILKKYGDAVPLPARYPDLPIALSLVTLLISVVVLLLTR